MKRMADPRPERRSRPTAQRRDDHRPWLATRVALGFVAVVLVSILLVPLLVRQRLDALREEINSVAEPARESSEVVSRALAVEVASDRAYQITGEVRYQQRFDSAWAGQEHAFATLARLAPQLGGGVDARVAQLHEAIREWAQLPLRAFAGGVSAAERAARMAPQERLFEQTVATSAALDDEIHAATQRKRDAAGHAASLAGGLTAALSGLALVALLLVTWLASELRRLAREEAEMRAELQALFAARDRLIRGFSHDIKNPLGAADGFAELMELGIIREASKQREALARIRRSISTALRLIEDVLDLARAEAGQLQLRLAPVDVRDIVTETADDYRAKAAAVGIDLSVDIVDRLPWAHSDAARIHQILGNLISNAIKYASAGGAIGVRISPASRWPGGRVADWLKVEVWDRGPGIPLASLDRVFDEFTRLEPDGGQEGSGLGLAISRRIARALGGELTVESRLGEGSRFILWLPAQTAVAA